MATKKTVPTETTDQVVEMDNPTPEVASVSPQANTSFDTTAQTASAKNAQVRSSGTPKIGIANRRNSSITVTMKKDSFILSAGAKTGKDYYQSDILAINNMSLQQAVVKGICTIIR